MTNGLDVVGVNDAPGLGRPRVRDAGCGRRGAGVKMASQGIGDVRILELIAQGERLRRQHPLPGRDDRRHFAQHEPEQSIGRTDRAHKIATACMAS